MHLRKQDLRLKISNLQSIALNRSAGVGCIHASIWIIENRFWITVLINYQVEKQNQMETVHFIIGQQFQN
jgi:hypothetical protein